MGKNGQGVHFSPFSTNTAVFLKFVSGDVFAPLIHFHHLLARLDSELSIVRMATPVLMPPIRRPLPSLLHKAPAAAAIMSCPLFCRLFSPFSMSQHSLFLLPKTPLTFLLYVATSNLPFKGSLSVTFSPG